jgi:chromate transporter
VTFTPCFLWIFLGAPYIEKLRDEKKLTAALTAVTAAVVGVILNLAVWFGIHVMLPSSHIDWFAVIVCAIAFIGMVRWKWDIVPVIVGSGLAGLVFKIAIPR